MRLLLTHLGLVLGLVLGFVAGCDSDENTGSANTFDPTTACSNVIAYCPSGYTWSGYATDATSCRTMFSCVYNVYAGSCRQIIADTVTCLNGVTAASGCSACNTIITRATTECSAPTSCLAN
jgi:hypothetical protein